MAVPDVLTRVSEYVGPVIEYIQKLIGNGALGALLLQSEKGGGGWGWLRVCWLRYASFV